MESKECCICLNSITQNFQKCPHCHNIFHTNCLAQWVCSEKWDDFGDRVQGRCPLCRGKIARKIFIRSTTSEWKLNFVNDFCLNRRSLRCKLNRDMKNNKIVSGSFNDCPILFPSPKDFHDVIKDGMYIIGKF